MCQRQLNILELFAGVGGFRVGLENSNPDLYKTKWANQWEPSKKSQDAFEVYNYKFPDSENINISIEDITNEKFASMDADIIVGGFPCQDYSVARSKKHELGIEGKKGVLFWQIIRATNCIKPKYLILENVDRLLKSPSKQRGRDFAIMLSAFNNLGYSVEWRVINAAEHGGAQRRRRVFFFVYRNDTPFAKEMDEKYGVMKNDVILDWDDHAFDEYIFKDGLFARQFPIKQELKYDGKKARHYSDRLSDDTVEVSDRFTGKVWNTGIMRYGRYFTIDTQASDSELAKVRTLGSISQLVEEVDESFYITDESKLKKFQYLRGPKKIQRTSAEGHQYTFSEGGMAPFDDLNLPGRTMLTSEGSVNRSTHLLKIGERYRLITPIEAERLNDFPSDWTRYKLHSGQIVEVSDRMRYFFMGNALVTSIIKRIGDELQSIIAMEEEEEKEKVLI
ncbi:DNA (cytosine-5)-methyltransferase 1 [Lysinibacillus composti]|uniref:Cytosine-specific methyltransferase n=1 Tax=Lysinibacillus composti TaxID=720633 RepID=A0A3N9UCT1_9BACI|nr:DNA (cytosine-5-)-methyltransferase [Lysinibacillus composti]MBM7609146.1 DNA (cytosine-5)-methyltransferase 1 [Lysinibacillus composti]RQW74203.1 DNA (cytosine-5-)-methyltransferase [Lysinibacillus composti]